MDYKPTFKLNLIRSEIPPRFKDAKLTDFSDDIKDICVEFVKAEGFRCLTIIGPTGRGKSHLACAMLRFFANVGTGIFIDALDMNKEIIEKRSDRRFKSTELLIIDEMGRSYDTPAEKNRFFSLVNHRYKYLLPMVIISNALQEDLVGIIGHAVASRIGEKNKMIKLAGPDMRKQPTLL